MTEVSGKTLLVTGGASGIGLGIARAFAGAGAKVAVADIDAAGAQTAAREVGGVGVKLDVSDHAAWPGAIAQVEAALGPIDILCNNAGIDSFKLPFEEIDEGWMRRLFEINLFGAVTGMRLLVPRMKARGGGHIVNVASTAAVIPPPNHLDYSGAKAALAAMSECLAQESRGTGLEVTIVCPGRTATRLEETTTAVMGSTPRKSPNPPPKVMLVGDDVGVIVLEAVRANRLWCFTHPENIDRVRLHWEAQRDAFAAISPRTG